MHNFDLICSTPDSAEESGDDLVFLPDVTFTDCNLIMNCDDTVKMTNYEADLSVDMECDDNDYELRNTASSPVFPTEAPEILQPETDGASGGTQPETDGASGVQ